MEVVVNQQHPILVVLSGLTVSLAIGLTINRAESIGNIIFVNFFR